MRTLDEIEAELDAICRAQPGTEEGLDSLPFSLPKKAIEVLNKTIAAWKKIKSI